MSGLSLDLSGAESSSFELLPAGTYDAVVFDATMKETKGGPTAKLPAGTPSLNIQFKINGGEYENRRVFRGYVIAPDKIEDKETGKKVKNENKGKTDGMLHGFLKAVGYDSDEIKSGKFNLDLDDLKGRECRVKVGVRPAQNGYDAQNEVKDVRPAGDASGQASTDDLGLLS